METRGPTVDSSFTNFQRRVILLTSRAEMVTPFSTSLGKSCLFRTWCFTNL